jgi:hypothetical protein
LVSQGWSLKELHREILCSATYQQSSADRPEALAVDPENQWLWKMNRRRLDFEGLRDNLLAVAGALDPEMGGRGVDVFKAPFSTRRTVYAFIDRQDLPGTFRTFDFASPDVSTPQRPQTLVPQQALYGLNSPFVIELAARAARRAQADVAAAHPAKDTVSRLIAEVQALYQGVLTRPASAGEMSLALAFVTEQAVTAQAVKEQAGAEGRVAEGAATNSGLSPLAQLAQALMLSNEFVFID